MIFYFFRENTTLFDSSGFGSVLGSSQDIDLEEGHLENLSTQAVLDLIKHVPNFDVEQEAIEEESRNDTGNLFYFKF